VFEFVSDSFEPELHAVERSGDYIDWRQESIEEKEL